MQWRMCASSVAAARCAKASSWYVASQPGQLGRPVRGFACIRCAAASALHCAEPPVHSCAVQPQVHCAVQPPVELTALTRLRAHVAIDALDRVYFERARSR